MPPMPTSIKSEKKKNIDLKKINEKIYYDINRSKQIENDIIIKPNSK